MKYDVEFYHDREFITVDTLRTDPETGVPFDGSDSSGGRVMQLRIYSTGVAFPFEDLSEYDTVYNQLRLRLGTGLMGVVSDLEASLSKEIIDPHQFKSISLYPNKPEGALLRVIDIVQLTTVQFRR